MAFDRFWACRRQYEKLAKRIGAPRYLLTDGAVELFESADVLEKPGEKLTVLRDMKHYAANVFEKLIGKEERVWLSTENLESPFGVFKQLEGQHSKGGFTSLLAAMPMMLVDWTPELVQERLSEVSVKQMKEWVDKNLGTTLASRRTTAYQAFAAANTG